MSEKDIWQQILTHQLDGVMFHDAMMDYFLALNMDGFYCMAKKQFREELSAYELTKCTFAKQKRAMIKPSQATASNLIPAEWYTSEDISLNKAETIEALRSVFTKWLEWEKSTCEFYKDVYNQAKTENLLGVMDYLDHLYCDVTQEIGGIRSWIQKLTSYDYDPKAVQSIQRELAYKYERNN